MPNGIKCKLQLSHYDYDANLYVGGIWLSLPTFDYALYLWDPHFDIYIIA